MNRKEGKTNETVYEKHILVESLMPRWIATGGLLWSGEALGVENGAFSTPGTAKVGDWNTNSATSEAKLKQNYGGTNPDFLENDVTPDGLKGYVVAGTQWFTGDWGGETKSFIWYFGTHEQTGERITSAIAEKYGITYYSDYNGPAKESDVFVGNGELNGYKERKYQDDATSLETFRRDFLMDAKMLGYEHYEAVSLT